MSICFISALVVGLTVLFGTLLVGVVLLFVVSGAFKSFAVRKNALKVDAAVDVSDGIDPKELEIIRTILLQQKDKEQQAEVKAKLAKVAQSQ